MATNTPAYRQDWIFESLKKESLSFTECFSRYLAIFRKTEQTFSKDWVKANERLKEYQYKVNKAKDEVSIATEVKALKSGIMTKLDRVAKLNKMLEDDYLHEVTTVDKGKPIKYKRPLTPQEIVLIHAELSKMGGDYAPSKKENRQVDENGNTIETDPIKALIAKGLNLKIVSGKK